MGKVPKLAIFLSGRGSNFEAIARACVQDELHASISVVFSNNPDAPGLKLAKSMGLDHLAIKHFKPRQDFEAEIVNALVPYEIDWVVLCGYMRVLSPYFLSKFKGRVINIHPSLLPLYPGVGAIKQALEDGASQTGVTVHFVDEGVDTGPIILQESLPILETDTIESLSGRVHALEHQVYKKALTKLISAP